MRKIASNYILLPDGGILKNSYVCVEDNRVVDVFTCKDGFKETANVEFYSGLLVVGELTTLHGSEGMNIETYMKNVYSNKAISQCGVSIITELDWSTMKITSKSEVKPLIVS